MIVLHILAAVAVLALAGNSFERCCDVCERMAKAAGGEMSLAAFVGLAALHLAVPGFVIWVDLI